MDIFNKLNGPSTKIQQQAAIIQTEEATKSAFVMPFISQILGYDVFDPTEVIPEFICDVGTKKGEKIDNVKNASQLFRYFHVTNARISILTNGQLYKFFNDLDAPNKMDEKPFLKLDLLNIDEHVVPELIKLTKNAFDVESIVSAAGELKYISQLKKMISSQFSEPDEELIKLFASRIYDRILTQKVREQFSVLTTKAAMQWLNDQVNERLKSAMSSGVMASTQISNEDASKNSSDKNEVEGHSIITTEMEVEGFHIVKSIIRKVIEPQHITFRDIQSYLGNFDRCIANRSKLGFTLA